MPVYSISNNFISISVSSAGAELVSLKSLDTELVWQADNTVWARYAPVLFPIVGKLKNNQLRYNRSGYKLSQHGFARDKEFVLTERSENILEFELTANEETMSIYPFHFSLRIRYELEPKAVKIKYIVFNPGNKNLFFSIGAHPGFSCKRIDGESIDDFYLEFERGNDLIAEKLSDGLLSGETYKIQLRRKQLPLNVCLFDNDAVVFKNKQIENVKLVSSKSKTRITLNCKNWPYFGIWSKKGSDSFVCLEPWHGIADSVNSNGEITGKEGVLSLNPYCTFETFFNIEVED